MSDTGTPSATPLTPEEIAEMDAMSGGYQDAQTGATVGEDGAFDFSTADADAMEPDDDGYGLDDFTDDANALLDTAGRAVDTVTEVANILDPPSDTPPERRRSSGTRNVSNEVEADEEAPAEEEDAPPSVVGWPEWIAIDTAGNVYVLGFVVPWWGVFLFLGAVYVVYQVIVFFFFSKKSKKKSWFF